MEKQRNRTEIAAALRDDPHVLGPAHEPWVSPATHITFPFEEAIEY
jgi:hypothetical protein